jgi:uncharacterized membrane protein YbhN (UPF0104 family)
MHVGRRDYWAAVRTSLGVLTTSPTTDIPRGTARQIPGAIVALILQSLAVIFLLLSAVTGLVGFLPAALVAVVAAFLCFTPTEKKMASQGVLFFGPEFAAAVGVR